MDEQLVRGYIFWIFPVEFNLKDDTVRVMIESWQVRWLGWLLYFFKDKDGNIMAPEVVVHAADPGVVQDCMRIMQWQAEACEKEGHSH